MKTDILFIDAVAMKAYNHDTIENDSVGGAECCTIRLAEGLASKGHSVSVVQRFNDPWSVSPNGVNYLPRSFYSRMQPKNVIHLRNSKMLDMYPNAKQFIWMHDLFSKDIVDYTSWKTGIEKYFATCVSISDWHQKHIKKKSGIDTIRIYSVADPYCYAHPRGSYDKNQLVWLSSPHKGLQKALLLFEKLRELEPEFKLAVTNPGYYVEYLSPQQNVIQIPAVSRADLRSVVSQSLCLFYPTQFEETLGFVAAESNALGTPVATYKIAALSETVGNEFAADEESLLSNVIKWRNVGRPAVHGNPAFQFENIYPDWLKILN